MGAGECMDVNGQHACGEGDGTYVGAGECMDVNGQHASTAPGEAAQKLKTRIL